MKRLPLLVTLSLVASTVAVVVGLSPVPSATPAAADWSCALDAAQGGTGFQFDGVCRDDYGNQFGGDSTGGGSGDGWQFWFPVPAHCPFDRLRDLHEELNGEVPDEVLWWWAPAAFPDRPCPILNTGVLIPDVDDPLDSIWTEPLELEPNPGEPDLLYLLRALLARVTVEYPQPVVYPAEDGPSIVHVPTFVEVTNWQAGITESDCLAGPTRVTCATLEGEPSLSFDPGEPGAGTIECEPPGSRFDAATGRAGTPFDPDGAEPDAQAGVAGACAYAYRRDTDGGTRTGEVIITWNVTWSSTINGAPGPSGEFDPVEFSASISRQVDEVQATVTEVNLGEPRA